MCVSCQACATEDVCHGGGDTWDELWNHRAISGTRDVEHHFACKQSQRVVNMREHGNHGDVIATCRHRRTEVACNPDAQCNELCQRLQTLLALWCADFGVHQLTVVGGNQFVEVSALSSRMRMPPLARNPR